MIYILDNIGAILAATLTGLAVGAIAWRLARRGPVTASMILVAALAEFWMGCILAGALILAPPEAPVWVMALGTPFIIWIGFVVPVIAVWTAAGPGHMRAGLGWAAHWLIAMMAMAAMLQALGLTAPN